ncbi:uncharacterized protein METZ01_LOCUS380609, partial [marine metagenome]
MPLVEARSLLICPGKRKQRILTIDGPHERDAR